MTKRTNTDMTQAKAISSVEGLFDAGTTGACDASPLVILEAGIGVAVGVGVFFDSSSRISRLVPGLLENWALLVLEVRTVRAKTRRRNSL
ncbi:MAG: hypothetical protein Q7S36_01290 [Candidatus Liptonbacteria bacterium]|nr:hypothetical protein [Candidatus Liptonbacteria bacterium]